MDPFDQLLDLRQGSSSIEEYIIQFCEITYKVPFDEVMLKEFFCFGLNEPIKSCLPAWKFNCSLKDFIDYALLCAGSSFTVGVAEEERDTASVTKMADAPEGTPKMAEGTTHHQFPGNRHESRHVSVDQPESLHVSADLPESPHVSADLPESLHVSADLPESLHVSADLPESLHVLPTPRVTTHPNLPESLHVSADCQSHFTSPLTCQSHFTSPLICQSHFTSPLICQSHFMSPLICQSLTTCLPSRGLPSSCLRSRGLPSSCLPSQGLLASGRPCRSLRPGWLPRLRMRLFGQD